MILWYSELSQEKPKQEIFDQGVVDCKQLKQHQCLQDRACWFSQTAVSHCLNFHLISSLCHWLGHARNSQALYRFLTILHYLFERPKGPVATSWLLKNNSKNAHLFC